MRLHVQGYVWYTLQTIEDLWVTIERYPISFQTYPCTCKRSFSVSRKNKPNLSQSGDDRGCILAHVNGAYEKQSSTNALPNAMKYFIPLCL